MLEVLPWLVAMLILMAFSAFFSASEAALFSLRPHDRRSLHTGGAAHRAAAALLEDPERLLSAVLFWNLVVNIAYFAIASIVEQRLPEQSQWVWPLRAGCLLMVIFCSEMLPKTVAVLISRQLAISVSLPLSLLVRIVDPIMPLLSGIMIVSQRLLWPRFEPEESLATSDLERAIELSTSDAKLLDQERTVLRNIVSLSDLRVDESMRPRTQIRTVSPPVRLESLEDGFPESGYMFITEPNSENVAAALRLEWLTSLAPANVRAAAQDVVYVPWCAKVADALTLLQSREREVAAVVNEWGETVGVLTIDDILDVTLTTKPGRSQRLFNREPIQMVHPGLWTATGMTNLRRVAEYFQLEVPPSHSKTIAGVVQEALQKMPQPNDACSWGPFEFEVLTVDDEGQMSLHLRLREPE